MVIPTYFPSLRDETQEEKIAMLFFGKHSSPERWMLMDKSEDVRLGITMDIPMVLRKQNGNSGSLVFFSSVPPDKHLKSDHLPVG